MSKVCSVEGCGGTEFYRRSSGKLDNRCKACRRKMNAENARKRYDPVKARAKYLLKRKRTQQKAAKLPDYDPDYTYYRVKRDGVLVWVKRRAGNVKVKRPMIRASKENECGK